MFSLFTGIIVLLVVMFIFPILMEFVDVIELLKLESNEDIVPVLFKKIMIKNNTKTIKSKSMIVLCFLFLL